MLVTAGVSHLERAEYLLPARPGGRNQKRCGESGGCAKIYATCVEVTEKDSNSEGIYFTSSECQSLTCGHPAYCRAEQRFYSSSEGAPWFEGGHTPGAAGYGVSCGGRRGFLSPHPASPSRYVPWSTAARARRESPTLTNGSATRPWSTSVPNWIAFNAIP